MSKFDYDYFEDGYRPILGFNIDKYTKEEALKIATEELDSKKEELIIEEAYVYFGFGCEWDGVKRNCWWIVDYPNSKSIKVWRVEKNERPF